MRTLKIKMYTSIIPLYSCLCSDIKHITLKGNSKTIFTADVTAVSPSVRHIFYIRTCHPVNISLLARLDETTSNHHDEEKLYIVIDFYKMSIITQKHHDPGIRHDTANRLLDCNKTHPFWLQYSMVGCCFRS